MLFNVNLFNIKKRNSIVKGLYRPIYSMKYVIFDNLISKTQRNIIIKYFNRPVQCMKCLILDIIYKPTFENYRLNKLSPYSSLLQSITFMHQFN